MKRENVVKIAVLLTVLGGALGLGYKLGGSRMNTLAPTVHVPGETPAAEAPARKILYYRNPMGLPDTSPVPKKDPMGMDYIPVFEGEEADTATPGQLKISTEKVQKLGVRTELVQARIVQRTVRAVGRIEIDESRLFSVTPKFEGWVEKLHVNVTGQEVAKGQPLFEVYSPELVSAQREYAVAARGNETLRSADTEARSGMQQLADASLARLENWDISAEQIRALASGADSQRTLTYRSPVTGVVIDKKALQGMRFMPGEALYQVADLSSVWVIADVFEQEIGQVKVGQNAAVRINAYPDLTFSGTVTYVYPTLKSESRTIPVRIELPNPRRLLKPAMFASVDIAASEKGRVLTLPQSAVIDSGIRRLVLVQLAEGRFEPREVKTGMRGDDYVEVFDGVGEGERVVVSANFLIDAESNLKAAVGGFGHAGHGGSAPPAGSPQGAAPASGSDHASHGPGQGEVSPEVGSASAVNPHAGH